MVGRPPDRSERRLAGIIVSLSALFFFLTVPFATTPLIPLWAFIPLYQAALAVCTLITAGFFFAMFSILRSRALLVLGCGYLFTALMVVPHSLTFPGLFTDSGLLGAGPQSTSWLYIFWHGTFPLFIIAYALLKNRRAPVTPFRASSRISLADGIIATVILAASFTLLATDGHDLLPPLIVDGVYTSEMKVASAIVWLLNPLALMVLWARRPHSTLDLWLMVAMCAWTFDVALSTLFNATRFDLGFYVGRIYGLLAATFVLLVLLVGTAGLYARVVGLLDIEKRARERTSEALRGSLARLDAIFSSAALSILTLNESGAIERLNPATERLFGLPSDRMAYRDIGTFIDFGDADDVGSASRLREMVSNGATLHPLLARHADGSKFPVEAVLAEMNVNERKMLVVFIHDARGKRFAEEKFRLAMESSPNGMVIVDTTGQIVLVNAKAERLFGYRRDELVGQRFENLAPGWLKTMDVASGHALPLPDELSTEKPELFGLRKNGTMFPIEIGLNQFETYEGRMTLCVVADMSERKRNDEIKDEFVATVSHELRTPLTAISASLSLLDTDFAGDQLPDSSRRLLTIAKSNSQRLVRLINDILDIEKIELGKIEYLMREIEVRPLVEQVIETTRDLAAQSGVTVRLDPASDDAIVYADFDRLTQVITNLLSNALKFSPKGADVELKIVNDGGATRISVRDHGPGIPEEFRPRIFRKFAQADTSDSREKGGTGLGLSIAKQLVVRFGGEIGFEDADGGGTIFYVRLPQFRSDAVSERAGGIPVLLCANDAESARILVKDLREAGFAPELAVTADDAVRDAASRSYAAILIDLQLSGRDDVSLIKHLRQQWNYLNTPIILVSVEKRRGPAGEPSCAVHVLDWLSKPLNVEHLARILSRPIIRNAHVRPRVLHVEPDRDVLKLVQTALGPIAELTSVDSPDAARDALAAESFDLAVIGVPLSDEKGIDLLLSDLRDKAGIPIPVIVFSGEKTAEVATKIFAALTKSRVPIDKLVATLRHIVARQKLQAPLMKEVA
jgi:PAS domain S-box-containing protein